MAATGARQQVGIAAADDHERHARHGVELFPQGGRGLFRVRQDDPRLLPPPRLRIRRIGQLTGGSTVYFRW